MIYNLKHRTSNRNIKIKFTLNKFSRVLLNNCCVVFGFRDFIQHIKRSQRRDNCYNFNIFFSFLPSYPGPQHSDVCLFSLFATFSDFPYSIRLKLKFII